jgi:hypothetical protein
MFGAKPLAAKPARGDAPLPSAVGDMQITVREFPELNVIR